ncbi:MAG: ATP synthase F0 subunit B [Deltaproteobacteria bacterium]|nr:ATP synthase F0 subunit B [Deltaproteobacteria bacterium]
MVPAFIVASSGNLIDLDATILLQLGIFFLMMLLLRSFLFKPVLRLIDARKEAIEGTEAKAKAMQVEAMALKRQAEGQLFDIRTAAAAERARMIEQARSAERDIAGATREDCQRIAEGARTKMEKRAVEVRGDLEREARTLVTLAAARALGRPL